MPPSVECDMISGMAAIPSPLVGYNTNVRHKGKLYHIQTEDSGIKRPHIITHLFADGGRIIATEKTSYEEQVHSEDIAAIVKKLMQDQHKRMFIALRDGVHDEDGGSENTQAPMSTEVLEHAAARLVQGSARYERAQTAAELKGHPPSEVPPMPFGHDVLTERTLDEVILAYLAQDLESSSR